MRAAPTVEWSSAGPLPVGEPTRLARRRLALRVDPCRRRLAIRAFEFVGLTWGVKFRLVDEVADADVVYSESPVDAHEHGVVLRCNPRYYARGGAFRRVEQAGEVYWAPAGAGLEEVDDVGTIFRFLGLLEDPQAPARQSGRRLSAFSVASLSDDRRVLAGVPLADHAARRVLTRVGTQVPDAPRRWPGGKRYAVSLTHDVDSPEIGNPTELAYAAAKLLVRRNKKYWWLVAHGTAARMQRRRGEFWTFADWTSYEQERGLRSAFYVYPRAAGVPRHRHDPRYGIAAARWEILRAIAAGGWEVGVHSAIRSRDDTVYLLREKAALERLKIRVHGTRHHYWEIDWADPWTTFRRQAAAGYRYDASMAWKDAPGFRSGSAHPFMAWDPVDGERIGVVTIPTCLMDGHLFEYLGLSGDAAVELGRKTIQAARAVGGVAVLDWHERSFHDTPMYADWRRVLDRLLDDVQGSDDVWLALPHEIAADLAARAQAVAIEP